MNTNQLKTYAAQARKDFMTAVAAKAAKYGIMPDQNLECRENGDYLLIGGNAYPRSIKSAYQALIAKIAKIGYAETINEIAYTWFNRMIALRYMELHNMLSHGYKIIGNPDRPEIMQNAAALDMPGLDKNKITDMLLDGTKDEQLYAYILQAQLNALNSVIPGLFEKMDDPTNLLIPDGLLMADSIRAKMAELDPSNFEQIEVIGWLYQFYIAEQKDTLMAAGKAYKKEEIPAVTQLFTPNWIVKYMVQNSVGAKWLETYPDSPLKSKMEYYIEPAEQSADVQAELDKIKEKSIDPETITVLDPACGSGHILVEAYDLLREIYLERGYALRDIPELILKNNIFGIDIDKRAAQLATFALAMKAAQDNPRLLGKTIPVNIINIVESNNMDVDAIANTLATRDVPADTIKSLLDNFENAQTYGSLIKIKHDLIGKLDDVAAMIAKAENTNDMIKQEYANQLKPFVIMGQFLTRKYDAVVANPPYMGNSKYNPVLKQFAFAEYPDSKSDLCTMFMEQALHLIKNNAVYAMINQQAWMFIAAFEQLRNNLLANNLILSMTHMGFGAFGVDFGTTAFVVKKRHVKSYKSIYISARENRLPAGKQEIFLQKRNRFVVDADNFNKIPGSPIAYWVGQNFIDNFKHPKLSQIAEDIITGMTIGDNNKYLRLWFEPDYAKIAFNESKMQNIDLHSQNWIPYSKGGPRRNWYGNYEYVVNWAEKDNFNRSKTTLQHLYLRKGITWPFITSGSFSARQLPVGFLWDVAGSPGFFKKDSEEIFSLGLLCSKVADYILKVLNPTINVQAADIANIPFICIDSALEQINLNVQQNLAISRRDWDSYETSWDFERLPMLTDAFRKDTVAASYNAWREQNAKDITETKRLEEENNRLFIDAYGLTDEITPDVPLDQITLTVNPKYRYGGNATDMELEERFKSDSIKELISYIIGCYMGRYSLDQNGLVYANAGDVDFDHSKYQTIPADNDGIIPVTDTAWFPEEDATNRIESFVSKVWGVDKLQENLSFIATALGGKPTETATEAIRRYMLDGFYKDHTLRYQKRPIYWMFSSGKNHAFDCLVYMHRINSQTLARIRTQFVIKLIDQMQTQLNALQDAIAATSSASEQRQMNKDVTRLQKQLQELLEYDEKLNHAINQKIEIDLDDGFKVNYPKFTDLVAKIA